MCGWRHAESEEARQDLVLRCLALLGLSGEAWDCSNAAATARCVGLADTLLPELPPILPSWRPPGMPPARSTLHLDSNAAAAKPAQAAPADAIAAKLGWLSPQPAYQAAATDADTAAESGDADPSAESGQASLPAAASGHTAAAAEARADATQAQLPTPWYLASEERRQFAVRMVQLLALGPFSSDVRVADALLSAEAAEAQLSGAQNHERAQATAQRLLAKHRDSLPLWQAYARQLLAANQTKVSPSTFCAQDLYTSFRHQACSTI